MNAPAHATRPPGSSAPRPAAPGHARWPAALLALLPALVLAAPAYAAWAHAAWRQGLRLSRGAGAAPALAADAAVAHGVAVLAAGHALAALGQYLFFFGWVLAPVGRGVPPLATSPGWAVLSGALLLGSLWVLGRQASHRRRAAPPPPADAGNGARPRRHRLAALGPWAAVWLLMVLLGAWQMYTLPQPQPQAPAAPAPQPAVASIAP